MKKLFTVIGLTAFIASMFLTPAAAAPTSQTTQVIESDQVTPSNTYIQKIKVERKFYDRYPPGTIYFNKHGWSGTLTRTKVENKGSYYLGIYEGYVTCTGICPMTNTITE